MIDRFVEARTHTGYGVGVESPALFFPFFDCLTDYFVVSNLDASPFFHCVTSWCGCFGEI